MFQYGRGANDEGGLPFSRRASRSAEGICPQRPGVLGCPSFACYNVPATLVALAALRMLSGCSCLAHGQPSLYLNPLPVLPGATSDDLLC